MFQLYRGGQFYWLGKLEYSEKTNDLPRVTEACQWFSPGTVESQIIMNVIKDVLVIQSL